MSKQYMNLEVQFNKLFRHLKIGSFKTRDRYGKVLELLGHHRDDVTRIYLAE